MESFKLVDKNEECDVRHLEIVCKRDSVPCIADIIEIFGEDIFPFITFKKSKLFLRTSNNIKLTVYKTSICPEVIFIIILCFHRQCMKIC